MQLLQQQYDPGSYPAIIFPGGRYREHIPKDFSGKDGIADHRYP